MGKALDLYVQIPKAIRRRTDPAAKMLIKSYPSRVEAGKRAVEAWKENLLHGKKRRQRR